ncbi:acyl-CoA dehydrogenase family protein [Gordonia hydrophobica]|uniref:Acyl-CoA dehydrogenase family protein n=1 Tax=Gordonia hydrophobica TaxID=40516 RepID=A0ABZ2U6L4_9ACTN|nr:acyl-CoA dehydrogenase family protein [Gordonia hydrophobica]MBM7365360.1 alkylation response protein AidB-like acyl-CoA dehydrogenase [Gordonia hydrophobica]
MPATRMMPTQESADLIELTRDLADKEMRPLVDQYEREHRFPRDVFRLLGETGLLTLPFDEHYGGGGQSNEVYLQVVEELASAWSAVGLGVSLHTLSCLGLVNGGTKEQQDRWLPAMLGGDLLGAYCLSEPPSGSDAGAMKTRAVRDGDDYVITGAKAWTTHGGEADFYLVLARTGEGSGGISAFHVDADTPGLNADTSEDKMGLMSSTTATMLFDGARVPAARRIGMEGAGLRVAFSALDNGRLGVSAVAVGLAQSALDEAVSYAKEREAFGRRIIDHQGLTFLLADMAAAVESARATYLHAARLADAGRPYSREASIAKLVCTDNAMKVTTDAVQVFGGAGYTKDWPVERYMREAKVMQIFEGTNQIQRLVIGRALSA